MRITARCMRVSGLSAMVLAGALSMAAQQAPQQTPQQPQQAPQSLDKKTAEEAYKSIKVLKTVPADQILPSMHVISDALAVNCEHCHVEPDFAKDDKKEKQTARDMMVMVADINKKSFEGQPVVTCYTCHHGSREPVTMSILPEMSTLMPRIVPPEVSASEVPSVDQILNKYVQALGGEQAIRKITSRVITGTREVPTGPGGSIGLPAQLERYDKAPKLTVSISRMANGGTVSEGFDGTSAWAQAINGVVADSPAIDQARAKRNVDLYESLNLKKEYNKIAVEGVERVNGRDAYLVIGVPKDDNPERLYFDVHTGLLVRKITSLPTPAGNTPFQVDYADYRDTGSGVKFPFLMHMVPATPRSAFCPVCTDFSHGTIRVQKVQDNVPIDDSKFVRPPSKAVPPRP